METKVEIVTEIVVVTGLSGAGKSTALHALEDLGFYCVDNLPTVLAEQAVNLCERGRIRKVALGVDVRVRAFLDRVSSELAELSAGGRRVSVLFLDAQDETLVRRFSETRRPHPMSRTDASASVQAVLEGVALERERLSPLRAQATRVIDTTRLSVHDLRKMVLHSFGSAGGVPEMHTRVVSFGFKFGVPVEADLVLDVRFLDNPHFVDSLKALPGTDSRVSAFVLEKPDAQGFLTRALALLEFTLPLYEREGKSHFTIAIGCTGGRHRSVAISEKLTAELRAIDPKIDVFHRDIERGAPAAPASERNPNLV